MPAPLVNPENKSDLIRWDVPFANGLEPSIGIITEHCNSHVTLVVEPDGPDRYPRYIVNFCEVIVLLRYENYAETSAIDGRYDSLVRSEYNLSAYRWITSLWLRRNQGLTDVEFPEPRKDLNHYLVIGENCTVEIISNGEPEIERIDKSLT